MIEKGSKSQNFLVVLLYFLYPLLLLLVLLLQELLLRRIYIRCEKLVVVTLLIGVQVAE